MDELSDNLMEEEEVEEEDASLATGFCEHIVKGKKYDNSVYPPYVQVLKFRPADKNKYYVTISDSNHSVECILGSRFSHLIRKEEMMEGSVIEASSYSKFNNPELGTSAILTKIEVLQKECELIGHPVALQQKFAAAKEPAPPVRQSHEDDGFGFGSDAQFDYTTSSQVQGNQGSRSPRGGQLPPLERSTPTSSQSRSNPKKRKLTLPLPGSSSKQRRMPPLSQRLSQQSHPPQQVPQSQRSHQFQPRNNLSQPLLSQEQGRAGGRAPASHNYQPIRSLNPYITSWVIRARVTFVGKIIHYTNQRGSGTFSSFVVVDKDGTDIEFICFGEQCERFNNTLEVDKIYTFSKGQVKEIPMDRKDRSRASVDQNYQIYAHRKTEFALSEDGPRIRRHFHFTRIADLATLPSKTLVDVVAVVKHVADLQEFQAKSGKDCVKRSLTIVDDSNNSVCATLWFDLANEWTPDKLADFPVVVFPACRTGDFGGVSLNIESVLLNQTDRRVTDLAAWWTNSGVGTHDKFKSLSSIGSGPSRKVTSWKEVEELKLGTEKPEYFLLEGTISQFKQSVDKPPWYLGEPGGTPDAAVCKVEEMQDGSGRYQCLKNGKTYDTFDPRWSLRLFISDCTKGVQCNGFNLMGHKLIGPAKDVKKVLEEEGEDAFNQIFLNASWQRKVFKIQAKMDSYNDDMQLKYTVQDVYPIDHVNEASELAIWLQHIDN